ncbi:MAG: alpha/beta fold hydrolase [Candidatus Aenigmatarchaeota archaeon]
MREKIYFRNSKGDKLCGIVSNPSGDKNKLMVVFGHGFASTKDSDTYIGLERVLNSHEISTLRFDFFGMGESEGNLEDITISEAVDDILKAIDYLKGLGYSRIGLMGTSFGGIASIIAVSKTKDLTFLILRCPVSDWLKTNLPGVKTGDDFIRYEKIDGSEIRIKKSFLKDAEKNVGFDVAEKITIPTLIIHGDADERVPVEQSIKLSKLIKNSRLEIIEGADHKFTKKKDHDKVMDLAVKFMVKYV